MVPLTLNDLHLLLVTSSCYVLVRLLFCLWIAGFSSKVAYEMNPNFPGYSLTIPLLLDYAVYKTRTSVYFTHISSVRCIKIHFFLGTMGAQVPNKERTIFFLTAHGLTKPAISSRTVEVTNSCIIGKLHNPSFWSILLLAKQSATMFLSLWIWCT